MKIFQKIVGPKSRYDKSIPYLYEARYPIEGLEGTFHSFHAETVCSLVEQLHHTDMDPAKVRVYEVYQDQEKEIEKKFWLNEKGEWLFKPEICRSFEEHYPGHIHEKSCSFEDRDKTGHGPY
ncbi:MAG: hypothetical protein HQL52_01055 [Magnetococcales bacterium]|nr:hypothetical protein [Magnetococcales bacterium]